MVATALAVLGSLTAAGARAEPAKEAIKDQSKPPVDVNTVFSKRLFAAEVAQKKKAYACFVRQYDAAHLAKHPLQKVNAMKLLVTGEILPEAEKLNYSFRLGVNFRKRPGNFDSSGACNHSEVSENPDGKEMLGCGVDCDGGGISIELPKGEKFTLVRLESIRIWRNNKPEEEGFELSGGADDKVFRLDRASLDQCKSLVTDRQELAAMRRK